MGGTMDLEKVEARAGVTLSKQKKVNKRRIVEIISPYLYILPSLVLILIVIIFPIYELFATSFSKVSLAGIKKGFIG
jgi:multiple sugar transport system permease protein